MNYPELPDKELKHQYNNESHHPEEQNPDKDQKQADFAGKNGSDSEILKSDSENENRTGRFSGFHMNSKKADQTDKKNFKDLIRKPVFWKAVSAGLGIALVISLISGAQTSSELNTVKAHEKELQSELASKNSDLSQLEDDNKTLKSQVSDLESQIDELENGSKVQLAAIKTAFEKGEWKKVIELYEPMHARYNGNSEDKEATTLKDQAQKKIDEAAAAKKKKEEEEARKKAEEEAKGYETGITYDQLARTPDDFIGKKVKFSGKVLQVQEGIFSNSIRLAVDGNYDTVVYGTYSKSLVKSKILEDDWITIYGTSDGDYTYTTVLGASLTIPGISIDKVDQ